jgi:hypothetical protein
MSSKASLASEKGDGAQFTTFSGISIKISLGKYVSWRSIAEHGVSMDKKREAWEVNISDLKVIMKTEP